MGSKKLVLCCIVGIVLGYLAPFVLNVTRSTSLSIGMVAGLAIGYLLDMQDEKKEKQTDAAALSQKAKEANRLLEQARAEVSGVVPDKESSPEVTEKVHEEVPADTELTDEEQAAKLNEAEELLRKARERIQ
ncbi:MAG: hypothetical protein IJI41_06240 [Anaerolineaceae bacterium]|nr:hypothetical protein [Anaerolineaceae bacterium]